MEQWATRTANAYSHHSLAPEPAAFSNGATGEQSNPLSSALHALAGAGGSGGGAEAGAAEAEIELVVQQESPDVSAGQALIPQHQSREMV